MKIEISEKYWIDVDELNYTVKQMVWIDEYTDKQGKLIEGHYSERLVGYYNSFEKAIEGLLKHNMTDFSEDMVISLNDYVNAVKKANTELFDKFRELFYGNNDAVKGE